MQPLWKKQQKENYLYGIYHQAQFLEGAHYLLLIEKRNLFSSFALLRFLLHALHYVTLGLGFLWIKAENAWQHLEGEVPVLFS